METTTTFSETFSSTINRARRCYGITLEDIASRGGVSVSSLSRAVRGLSGMTLARADSVMDAARRLMAEADAVAAHLGMSRPAGGEADVPLE